MREVEAEVGFLKRADGSCKWTQGDTIIVVGIYGPVEVPRHQELIDKSFIDISVRPAYGNSNNDDREIEDIILKTIEKIILSSLYPRTKLKISFQVINNDGSLLSACINGCIMALLDAAIPLKYMIASVSIAYNNNENNENEKEKKEYVSDFNNSQQKQATSCFTFTFGGKNMANTIINSYTHPTIYRTKVSPLNNSKSDDNKNNNNNDMDIDTHKIKPSFFDQENYFSALELAREECNSLLLPYYRECMEKKFNQS